MKKLITAIIAIALAISVFAVGYNACYLNFLRNANFYTADEMLIIELGNDWNEVDIDGDWDDFLDKHAKG